MNLPMVYGWVATTVTQEIDRVITTIDNTSKSTRQDSRRALKNHLKMVQEAVFHDEGDKSQGNGE